MKKVIITITIAASISLGFTLIENKAVKPETTSEETVDKAEFKEADLNAKQSDKRIASWD